MDFRQITQPNGNRPANAAPVTDEQERHTEKAPSKKTKRLSWFQLFNGVILVGVAVLVAGIAIVLARSNVKTPTAESTFVQSSKYQAVFMNNGQVYFGKVVSLNSDYLRMKEVYYLTQSSDSNSSDYTLVKLGCQQIHDPYDEMVMNRTQVTFWENLNDDGRVVDSIKKFKQQNPNGPDCSQVSSQTQADSNTNTQGATKK